VEPDQPDQPAPAPARAGPAPRVRRWLVRAALVVVAAVAVVAAGAAVVLHQLDAPWLKGRIVAAVRSASGVELDYRTLRLRLLSGLVLEDLVVRTPPALRELEPDLVRVARIEVAWSPGSLLGRGPRLARVAVDGVAVALVTDEHGRSSLDLAPRRADASPRPAPSRVPVSRRAAELLSSTPPLGRLDLTRLDVTVVRAAGGRAADRFAVRGLSLHAEAEPAGPGHRLRVAAGAPGAPLAIDVARDGSQVRAAEAHLDAVLGAELSSAGAAASLDVRVRAQSFAADATVGELLHAEATASFDAARGRTEVSLSGLRAADGAASLEGKLVIDDAPGALPLVPSARGDVDVARLLRLVPPGLVPATLARGEAHWRAEGLVIGAPFLVGAGSLSVDAALDDLRASLPGGALAARSARLTARATEGPKGHATLRADGLRVAAGPRRIEVPAVEAQLEAARAGDGTLSGHARVEVPAVDVAGDATVAARQAHLELRASALRLVAGAPRAAAGTVELSGALASLAAQTPGGRVAAEGARLDLRLPLGGPPYAARAELPLQRLRVLDAGGRTVLDAPAHARLSASGVVPDADHPVASRGVAELAITLGPVQATVRAAKEADAVAVDLRATATELASLRPSQGAAPAWQRMPIDLATTARVTRLASPAPHLEQRTTARLAGPAWAGVSADEATLELRSGGDTLEHRADLDVRLRAIRAGGIPPADQHLAVSAHLDRRRTSAEQRADLKIAADGATAGALTAAVALDPGRGAVRCDLDGSLERLGALVRLGQALAGRPDPRSALSGLDLDRLALSVRGEVLGAVTAGPDGAPRPAAAPLRTAAPAGTIDVRAAGLTWRTRDRTVTVPSGTWRATFRSDGPRRRRSVESTLELSELHVDAGEHRLDAAGLVHRLAATLTGDPATGELDSEQHLELASLRQDFAPYPVEGARVTVRARRDRDGGIELSDLRVDNAAGGTALAARGVLDATGLGRRLSLEGRVEQDLARASTAPGTFSGSGRVTAQVSVESPDLKTFRTVSAVRFDGVHARLPAAGIAVEALEGEVPVSADVALRAGRARLLRQSGVNPYPTLRFADQHPLLTHASFVTAARLETAAFSAAPLAGNVKVEQNLVSVNQLEMGVRGGSVTGACVLDLNGPRTTLEARVRATGVQSSRGEPFDGNAAVVVSASDRSVVGRAEILRIGRRHLLDLLDVQDPHRTNAATNRVRHALALGYPDRVRITFDHGFASARVTFGGLARLVQLEDLRGIPMGPLVDRALAPFSHGEDQP
jgi:hypothetical protein